MEMPLDAHPAFRSELTDAIRQLDDAALAHLEWSARVLRCAVLKSSPGDDVMSANAHQHCALGRWYEQCDGHFDFVDQETLLRLGSRHRAMHDAVRVLCGGILAGSGGAEAALVQFEHCQADVVAALAALKTECFARGARIDELTGLPLRYSLAEDAQRFLAMASRHSGVVVALLMDIDQFKGINDTHGHAAGDDALRHAARLLRQQVRAGELLFRLGGDEFLALVQIDDSDQDAEARMATRLLQALRARPLHLRNGEVLRLTTSMGLSRMSAGDSIEEVIARADMALYEAKRGGRDTFRCHASADARARAGASHLHRAAPGAEAEGLS